MARPTKLTPESKDRIVQAIKLGATYEHAAAYGGVAYNTFNEWIKKGKDAKSGIYVEFHEAIKEAEGVGLVGWLQKIEDAANDGQWQAAAWKAERRYPEIYGRQSVNVKHSGDTQTTVRVIGLPEQE
jgi:hypothetical protein